MLRTLAAAGLIAMLVLMPAASPRNDARDPRSVEWLCTHQPQRVRALFDSLNLELPALAKVKKAVADGDYPRACTELIDYYRHSSSAPQYRGARAVKLTETDGPGEQLLADKYDHYGVIKKVPRTPAGEIDWSFMGEDPALEWGQDLNCHSYFGILFTAYLRTSNPAYVGRIDADTRDWVLSNPYPARLNRKGPWGGITIFRRVMAWPPVFYGLQNVDEFSPAARILMLSSIADHARHLMLFHRRDDNNWTLGEVSMLGVIGCLWPEFRDAPGWRAYSQEQVGRQLAEIVYPDGAEAELTSHYHRIVTENVENYVDTFRRSGFAIADSIVTDVMRMWSYAALTLRPDGTIPENNDSDRRDGRAKLKEASKRHDRPDWLYVATNGADGVRPRIGPSVTFPWAGHAIMRSGWDANAQWSFFDAGPFGLAHPHYDKLHISIDAFGRALLVDAGRFEYANGPYRDYFMGSASHNVLLIDGAGQNKLPERAESPMVGTDYGSTPEFDYARGVFDAGYQNVLGRAVHTRTVIYLHDKYWVVADRLETDRARRVEALWHFAPECNVAVDGRSVASNDAGQGNLRVQPVGGIPWRVDIVKGREKPVQGWYSPVYTKKVPSPTAVYTADIPGTTTFAWVLLPARGDVPAVDTRVVSSRADRIEVRVQVGDDVHIFTIPMNSWRPSVRRGG